MSKKSRARRKKFRSNQRMAEKAAKKALYAKFGAEGRERGSKRAKRNAKSGKLVKDFTHQTYFCGNVGCKRCFPMMPKSPSNFDPSKIPAES